MSNFTDEVKKSTNTATKKQLYRDAESSARDFCDALRYYIKSRAEKGDFKCYGGKNYIEGYLYIKEKAPDSYKDLYRESLIPNDSNKIHCHFPISNFERVAGNEIERIDSISRLDIHKKGWLSKDRWIATFRLSSLGKQRLSAIEREFKEDDITISHVWVVRKCESNILNDQWNDHYDEQLVLDWTKHIFSATLKVYSAYKFTFRF